MERWRERICIFVYLSLLFHTHLLSMSGEKHRAQSASWQLEMLILAHERGLTVHWGSGPHQFVYSVIIWSRHLDCVLAEHQRPCRDCWATRQLHWPLICMNSRPNDRRTYGVWLQKRALAESTFKSFLSKLSLGNSMGLEWFWVSVCFKWC